MTDILLLTALPAAEARSAAKRRGIRAAFVGMVDGKAALLAGMESYDRILAWWLEGSANVRDPRSSGLRCTARADAMLDRGSPLVAAAPQTKSPLAGITLNGRGNSMVVGGKSR